MSTRQPCSVCGSVDTRGNYAGPCATCGVPLCPKHALFYVDDMNAAINRGSRAKCAGCYGGNQ